MARMQPKTIVLGENSYVIRPLTLRQVQQLEPILLDSGVGKITNIQAAIQIVGIALERDCAEAAKTLLDMEITPAEIGAAMSQVLILGGFSNEVDPEGEAKAE